MEIQITVIEDGKVILQENANSFMEAEEAIGALEKKYEQFELGESRNKE